MKKRTSVAVCLRLVKSAILVSVLPMALVGCRTSRPIGLLGARAIVPPPHVEPTGMSAMPAAPSFEALPAEPVIVTDLPPSFTSAEVAAGGEGRTPEDVASKGMEIVLPPTIESQIMTYSVKKGDNLWDISCAYGITHQELAAYNNLQEKAILKIGQVLNIPPGGRYVPPEKRPKIKTQKKKTASPKTTTKKDVVAPDPRTPIPADGKYVVKAGDSLWKIARNHDLKSADIRQLNNLKSDVLKIGQVLLLPAGSASPPAAAPENKEAVSPMLTPMLLKPAENALVAPAAVPAPAPKTVAPALETGIVKDNTDPLTTAPLTTPTPEKTVVTEPIRLTADPLATFPKKLDHLVSKGETLKMIAEMYGTTTEAIVKENPQIKTDADLKPSTKIMVPYR